MFSVPCFGRIGRLAPLASLLVGPLCLAERPFPGPYKIAGEDPTQDPVVADFNGDGFVDLAAVNDTDDQIHLYFGDGSGAFPTRNVLEVGQWLRAVEAADVNNDGVLDLIAGTIRFEDRLEVFLGDGQGGFEPQPPNPINSSPFSFEIADLNGDGIMDIVVGGITTILDGLGGGVFSPGRLAGRPGTAVAIGDLNNDGFPDLAIPTLTDEVVVLLNDGSGEFPTQFAYDVQRDPRAITMNDVTSDGIPDLLVSNTNANSISVLAGRGDGQFDELDEVHSWNAPYCSATPDLNGDGRLDLIVANATSGDLRVFHGDGAGAFDPVQRIFVGIGVADVNVHDVTGDGRPDIVASPAKGIVVAPGAPDGLFEARPTLEAPERPEDVAIDDLNGDGHEDVIAVGRATDALALYYNIGHASFLEPIILPTGEQPMAVATADLNGDGRGDVVVANLASDDISVRLSTPGGGLGPESRYPVSLEPIDLDIGDLNGDGSPDVVVANSDGFQISVLLNLGDGQLQPASSAFPNHSPFRVRLVEVNGDEVLDLISLGGGEEHVMLGVGDGTFGAPTQLRIPACASFAVNDLIIGDFDGDAMLDTAVVSFGNSQSSGSVGIRYGGDEEAEEVCVLPGLRPIDVEAIDLDGDGRLEFVVVNRDSGDISIIRGAHDRMLVESHQIGAGDTPRALAIGDIDEDGLPDIVTPSFESNTLDLFLSGASSPRPADLNGDGVVNAADLAALIAFWGQPGSNADLNGDGFVGAADLAALIAAWG